MLNVSKATPRIASALLAGLLLVAAKPSFAQDTDPRWQAWLGCWAPADMPRIVGATAQAHAVCVVPSTTPSAVDIATIENGKVASRQRMEVDGAQHASTRDGCTGWESAQWSAGRRRVFVRSEYTCPGGLARTASGLFTINGEGHWLDIEGVSAGGNKGVRALRYSPLGESTGLPDEIVAALRGRNTAVSAARVSVAASLTIDDIVEASHRLDANVVDAWLVEFNAGAEMKSGALNARQLAALADEGIPSSTIDVIVALAYPKVFALNPATNEGEFRVAEGAGQSPRSLATLPVIGYDAYGFPIYGADRYMSSCSSFLYSPYYASSFGCSPYCYGYSSYSSLNCARYGSYLGYGYGYGGYGYGGYGSGYGWYPGGGPVVIVVRGSDLPAAEPHGSVQKGRGYTQGSSSSGSSSSTPRSTSSGSSSSGSSASAPSGGSSAGSSSSGGGSSSGRTAVPKKP